VKRRLLLAAEVDVSELHARSILVSLAGSRAHGMAGPDSDVDVLGVALPTHAQVLGVFQAFEQQNRPEQLAVFAPYLPAELRKVVAQSKIEGTVYSLAKLLRLAWAGNPNILEFLYTRDSERVRVTGLGERLIAARGRFVTGKCRHTFGGYAASQLQRIELHHRWHHDGPKAKPSRADFGLPERTLVPREHLQAAEAAIQKQIDTWALDWTDLEPSVRIPLQEELTRTLAEWRLAGEEARWKAAARWVGLDVNLMVVMQAERSWRHARGEHQRYQAWLTNRNPSRAGLEAEHGYDTKHGAHLVRLLRMGMEIVSTGQVHVWRGDRDAEELLHIKAGGWSFEALREWTQRAKAELAAMESVVPKALDKGQVDALCVDLTQAGL
jgi:predicted nucleotidyltransferase